MKNLFKIFLVILTIFLTCTNAEKSSNESKNITEKQDRPKFTKIVSISQNESGDLTQKPEERKKFSGMKFSGSKGSFGGTKLSSGKTSQKNLHTTGKTYKGGSTFGLIVGLVVTLPFVLVFGIVTYLNHNNRC